MPILGGVADDLTGATTTGVLLARSDARTAVFFNEEAALNSNSTSELDAIMISSNSRPLPANEAYNKVKDATQALINMGVKYFQKRIDTTCRGGIGVEIDAMLDLLPDTIAVVVPTMPQSRRIMVGGYSVIDGVALINTAVAQDVRTPVKENYIPDLIASQTRRKVGNVELNLVLRGKDCVRDAITTEVNKGAQIVIVDAITIDDVDTIAKACIELKKNVLAVDPGPFTARLAFNRNIIKNEKANIPNTPSNVEGKTVLVAAGSATPVTKKQMEVLMEDNRNVRISVDALSLVDGGEKAVEESKKAIEKALWYLRSKEQPRAILIETALHGELLDLDAEDKKHHYPQGMSADRINAALGYMVGQILDKESKKIAGIYTTGGDTQVNVCKQLNVESLEVLDYVIPQADISRLTGKYAGMPIVGKGGLTGTDTTAVEIVNRLFCEYGRVNEVKKEKEAV